MRLGNPESSEITVWDLTAPHPPQQQHHPDHHHHQDNPHQVHQNDGVDPLQGSESRGHNEVESKISGSGGAKSSIRDGDQKERGKREKDGGEERGVNEGNVILGNWDAIQGECQIVYRDCVLSVAGCPEVSSPTLEHT
jgi:hypothetical protein